MTSWRVGLQWSTKSVLNLVRLCKNQQFYIKVIMKQQKNKEEMICGWANDNDMNYDAAMLTNILIRKATVGALPQISNIRNKTQMQVQKHLKTNALTKGRHNHKSNHILKLKRQKTEGYDYQLHEPVYKHQYEQFLMKQQRQVSHHFIPCLNQAKQLEEFKRYANNSQNQCDSKGLKPNSKREQSCSIFSKTMKINKDNTKSQESIHEIINKFEPSIKRSEQKLYVRLNTLEMVNDLKRHVRYDCLQKIQKNGCKTQQRDYLFEKRKRKIDHKQRVGSIDKMNQKLKSTFTKKDVFNKQRRRLSRSDNVEFSDQVIFSNNSIVINKQIMTNPFLHTKIQILRQPIKNQLPFK